MALGSLPLKPSPRCACGRSRVHGGCPYHSPQHVRGGHTYTDVKGGHRIKRATRLWLPDKCSTSARECRSSMCVLLIEMCAGGAHESEDGAPHAAPRTPHGVVIS